MSHFSDELPLDELLPPAHQAKVIALLEQLSGASCCLSHDQQGEPVTFNLETVACLKANLPPFKSAAAVELLELLLFHAGKYRLAANLHQHASEASYQALQQRNAELEVSETRYRRLSETLQQKIDEQVKLIEQSQHELYESARLRAVGQLAAGIAHEINTPIGFIASNLGIAKEYLEELSPCLEEHQGAREVADDFQALLDESAQGANKIASIVNDLRTFSNLDQADFAPCNINALAEATCNLLQAEYHHGLCIELRLGQVPTFYGYPAKVSQALLNVLDNAAKAVGRKGRIHLDTYSQDGLVIARVSDDGDGICEEVKRRAFEPFFTTRDVGAGTGLGLCVVRDVVAAHHGRVTVESDGQRGVTVTMAFGSAPS
ncbi:two-component sensor histidine kinase [Halomonas sp. 1513]|nr:HAMP domain-containing sensor histidine kinase [Halomonas sp. 1513]APX94752.1 two-component sensor histidine kinase [Halomonas sp. 1513]